MRQHYHIITRTDVPEPEIFTSRRAARRELHCYDSGFGRIEACTSKHYHRAIRDISHAIDDAISHAQQQLDEGWQAPPEEYGQTGWEYDQLLDVLQQGIKRLKEMRGHSHQYRTNDDESRCICVICGKDGDV